MSKNASVHVDCSKPLNRVSPYLWGNFVEDIRDHMDRMLAYPIKGMDFEHEPEFAAGVSGPWTPITDGKTTKFSLEPAALMHSGHSQKIKVYSADKGFAGLSQRISVQENTVYTLNMYARASLQIKYAVVDLVDTKTDKQYDACKITLTSHDWRHYTGQLTVPAGCTDVVFRICIFAGDWEDSIASGILWLDHVSLLPTDHVAGVKRAVFDMTKDLSCHMLRFGGNHISSYHWKHFVGPTYYRPSMLNEAWGGWTTKYFGTDEFIEFCNALGVEPLICINFGSGTAEEAADWVEYCNGDQTTKMGALRAQNGHPEPYKVQHWEVGNEVYGKWQIGHCDATSYALRYQEFARAMREVDPDITLLACGHWQVEWNEAVLQTSGEFMDMLTIHIYPGARNMGHSTTAGSSDVFKSMRCSPEFTRGILEKTSKLIEQEERLQHIKLALTEYNTMYQGKDERKGLAYEHTLQSAVANAANWNEFIRQSDIVEIANFSDLVNGWQGGCIRVGNYLADQNHGQADNILFHNVVYGTPTYYALKLYGNNRISRSVETFVKCDDFDIEGAHPWTEHDKAPVLDVVSGLTANGSCVDVFVVNRGLEDIECTFSIDGFDSKAGRVYEISDEDLDAQNTVHNPERVTSTVTEFNYTESTLSVHLLAHSVYKLEFMRSSK